MYIYDNGIQRNLIYMKRKSFPFEGNSYGEYFFIINKVIFQIPRTILSDICIYVYYTKLYVYIYIYIYICVYEGECVYMSNTHLKQVVIY